jgi:hypothetical protein
MLRLNHEEEEQTITDAPILGVNSVVRFPSIKAKGSVFQDFV